MAKPHRTSRASLDAALAELVDERKGGGPRVTLAAACRRSGVSRATANRDAEFVKLVKRSAAEADERAAAPSASAGPTRREKMSDLKQTNNDMANIIAVLSIAYQKLEAEVAELRATVSGRRVVPINASRGER